jgi:hypothetical protein
MMLRGYRAGDLELLSGTWLSGELLGLPLPNWPVLAEPATVGPPSDETSELCVAPGTGFVRYCDVDWVHRRARLEIGVRREAVDSAELLISAAVAYGFRTLSLRRVYGWVTPATHPPPYLCERAGLQREATIPSAVWFDGRPVPREIWAAVRRD